MVIPEFRINPRSISLWVKTGNKDGGFIGWEDTSDKMDWVESNWSICQNR